jgi:membrane-associated protease RseP (regulator of RpoE activity)
MPEMQTSISSPPRDEGKEGIFMRAAFLRARYILFPPLMALMVASALFASSCVAEEDEDKGWLGVRLQGLTSDIRDAMDISTETGVLVTDIVDDSPAEEAGIEVGDVIQKFDGQTVSSPGQLSRLVGKTAPGQKVKVEISRDGQKKTITAQIGEREAIEKICKIKISGDEGEEDLLIHCLSGVEGLGFPHCLSAWLGPDIWLGVHTIDLTDQLAEYFDIKDGLGVLISEVFEDSPAEKAKLEAGDVIVKAGGKHIEDTSDLREAIAEHEEGDEIELMVIRHGKEKKLKAILEKKPHKEMKVIKKLRKIPQKLKCKKWKIHSHDAPEIDVEIDKALEDIDIDIEAFDLEDLDERLEELEEELERIKERLEMD